MKHKILICSALPLELKIIKSQIKKLNIKDLDIKFLLTWVWNYNTIYSLKDYIAKNSRPDFLLNLWVCWFIWKNEHEIIQIYRIKNSSNNKERLLPIYINYCKKESILSSEEIVTTKSQMWEEKYVDMESYWVDYVCEKEYLPFLMLKIPFDKISEESKNVNLQDLEDTLISIDYKNILEKVLSYLKSKNHNNIIDLSYYKDFFSFTFSEYEIFKKNYNKFLALDLDFKYFFEKNKNLTKKEFLGEMQKK